MFAITERERREIHSVLEITRFVFSSYQIKMVDLRKLSDTFSEAGCPMIPYSSVLVWQIWLAVGKLSSRSVAGYSCEP